MKLAYLTTVVSCLLIFSNTAFSCDESCKREQAKAKHALEFPSYLTWEYCDGLKHDFMTIDMNSLQSYSSKHLNFQYKGPVKNIINLVEQRKEWLIECDQYISATREERIFYDDKTTLKVFAEMDALKKELNGVLEGARYSSFLGDETETIVKERFNTLFTSVDNHKNLMHLKGKYVYQ